MAAVAVLGLSPAPASADSSSCTIYWTGASSTAWSQPANWSLTNGGASAGRTPDGSDEVCFSSSAAHPDVDLDASTSATIAGIDWPARSDSSPALTLDGTLLIGSGDSTIDSLDLDAGTLGGDGTLTVPGAATLGPDGTLGDDGQADLVLQDATTVNGVVALASGSELENQGSLTMSDGAELEDSDSSGNELLNDGGATIISGTSGGAGDTETIDVPAVNNGTVRAVAGTLQFGSGTAPATESGTYSAAAGAIVQISGDQTEAEGSDFAGAGTVDVTANTTFTADTTLTSTGSITLSGGAFIDAGVTVDSSNLDLEATLAGPGGWEVTGPTTLGVAARVQAGGHLTLDGATTADGLFLYDGSELENEGTLTVVGNTSLTGGGGNELLNDPGATVTHSDPDGTGTIATIDIPSVNDGTVTVPVGGLQWGTNNRSIDPPGTDSGTYSAAADATLYLTGNQTEGPGVDWAGAGTIEVIGGVSFLQNTQLSNTGSILLVASNGTTNVPTGVTITSENLDLQSQLSGGGTWEVTGPATLNGALYQTNLVLDGASDVAGMGVNDAELENQGVMTLEPRASIVEQGTAHGGDVLVNDSGATITTGDDPSTDALVSLPEVNRGTVVAAAGTLTYGFDDESDLDTGTFTADTGATLRLGDLTEAPTADFTGAGTFDIAGQVTFTGSSTLNDTGPFEVDGTAVVDAGAMVSSHNLSLIGVIQGPGTWSVDGPASLQIHCTVDGATLQLDGSTTAGGVEAIDTATIENAGTLTMTSGSRFDTDGSGSQLINDAGATITNTDPSDYGGEDLLSLPTVNDGTIDATVNTTMFSALTNLSPDGTLTGGTYIADGGVLDLGGPITTNDAAVVLGAGGSSFDGDLDTLSANEGSLELDQPEALTGTLTETGTLHTMIGASGVGELSAAHAVSLHGTLDLKTASGYVPPLGSKFTILTGKPVTGNFSSVTGKRLGDRRYVISHTSSAVIATVASLKGTPPTVTAVAPDTGPAAGGTSVTIIGTGFSPDATASFGSGQPATSVTYDSPTELTVISPATSAGVHNVFVTTSAGTSAATHGDRFTSVLPPSVTKISPASGPTAGGTTVTITGKRLGADPEVSFGSTPATKVTVVSATEIQAVAPPGPTGTVDVIVSTVGGSSPPTTADRYRYRKPASQSAGAS